MIPENKSGVLRNNLNCSIFLEKHTSLVNKDVNDDVMCLLIVQFEHTKRYSLVIQPI